MGGTSGPNIVEDNIILHLDAANNKTMNKKYESVFKDMSTKKIGQLKNGCCFLDEKKGVFYFDGMNDFSEFFIDGDFKTKSYTICCFAKSNSYLQPLQTIFGFSKNGYAAYGYLNLQSWYTTTASTLTQMRTFFGGSCQPPWGTGSTPACGTAPWGTFSVNRPLKEIEDWNFYTSIMTPTHMKQFINDELLIDSESTGNLARRNSFDRFWLGQRGGGHYWNGEIGSVIVYEKALTNQEVLQNYNALKSRFIS
jgi:hypothetical protein